MGWDFSTEPEFAEQLVWMRSFVDDEIIPLETLELDELEFDRIVAPLRARVKEHGLWAAHLPRSLGGEGLGQVKLALMHEILGRSIYAPTIFGNQAPDSGNAELIALAGTDAQKDRWLAPLLAGEIRSAFSMTEPDTAGSDPTLLRTRAVRDGDEWVLSGRKWFTSNGSVADVLIVMAISDPDTSAHRGASMFLVSTDSPGVDIVRDIPTMEDPVAVQGTFRAGGFGHAEIAFRDARVPAGGLLGGEGEGFALAQARLGPGRIHHCMRWLGQSQRAFDMLCERALSREAHGGLLADKQTVQNWIADSAAEMHAARLMTLHAAWMIDQFGAKEARTEIAMIKYYGASVLYNVIDRALQLHGGLGYSTDMPLESMYRFARAARIYDGPDEVHRVSVARRILRRYARRDVPTEHVPTRREAAIRKFGDLLERTALEG